MLVEELNADPQQIHSVVNHADDQMWTHKSSRCDRCQASPVTGSRFMLRPGAEALPEGWSELCGMDFDHLPISYKARFQESMCVTHSIMKTLVKADADITAQDSDGNTVLHKFLMREWSMQETSTMMVLCDLVCAKGSVLEMRNALGLTPLAIAHKSGCMGVRHWGRSCGAYLRQYKMNSTRHLSETSKVIQATDLSDNSCVAVKTVFKKEHFSREIAIRENATLDAQFVISIKRTHEPEPEPEHLGDTHAPQAMFSVNDTSIEFTCFPFGKVQNFDRIPVVIATDGAEPHVRGCAVALHFEHGKPTMANIERYDLDGAACIIVINCEDSLHCFDRSVAGLWGYRDDGDTYTALSVPVLFVPSSATTVIQETVAECCLMGDVFAHLVKAAMKDANYDNPWCKNGAVQWCEYGLLQFSETQVSVSPFQTGNMPFEPSDANGVQLEMGTPPLCSSSGHANHFRAAMKQAHTLQARSKASVPDQFDVQDCPLNVSWSNRPFQRVGTDINGYPVYSVESTMSTRTPHVILMWSNGCWQFWECLQFIHLQPH